MKNWFIMSVSVTIPCSIFPLHVDLCPAFCSITWWITTIECFPYIPFPCIPSIFIHKDKHTMYTQNITDFIANYQLDWLPASASIAVFLFLLLAKTLEQTPSEGQSPSWSAGVQIFRISPLEKLARWDSHVMTTNERVNLHQNKNR